MPALLHVGIDRRVAVTDRTGRSREGAILDASYVGSSLTTLVWRADGDRWRIQGVIDWESAGTGSPLVDIGSLFRYAPRYDEQFRVEFERGYREAGGTLPDDWYRLSRTLDAFRLIDTLDGIREMPGVFADCRMLLAKLVADLAV
jgi:hypothetical protein